jgi:outer membrane protein TolC
MRLDLFRSLEYAVQHSREYQTQAEQLYLSALDVTLERHLFDPRFFANASYIYNGGQQDVDYRSALTATGQAGVRQKLPYGGEIVASGLVQFVDALNDSSEDGESAQLALTGTIPLLRGAGMVNLENLINSERQLVYTVRTFEEYRRGFAVDVATAYFRIMTAQQSVVNRRANYRNLEALLERSQALYEAGRLNFLQVQVSASSLYSAENSLVNAEANLDNTIDDFKLLIGMPIESSVLVMPSALDVTVPDIENRDVIAMAHKYRLDLQTRRDQVDDAHRQVEVAANGLLPDFNVVANANTGNRLNTPAARLDARSAEYSAGLTLDLPVDRVAERNAYRKSLIQLDRARRDLESQKESIAADVLTRIRAIHSAEAAVAIQTRSIELAQRRLEYATELLKEGKTTDARNVTDAQQALLSAQDAYEDARASLQIEVLRFLRDTGTLRVDPHAGALGRALDRLASDPTDRPQAMKTQ